MITFDYQNKRQIPPSNKCTRLRPRCNPNLFINEVDGSRRGKRLAQRAFLKDLGYGYYRWPGGIKAGTTYEIQYYDFAGANDQDFTVTMYAAKRSVAIKNPRF